jgi:Lon protease-like protein
MIKKMATQQLTIPMFPLNMVLLPGETKTLHIFEERYKQLVSDCIENDAHFGIPFINQKAIGDFGIEVKINNVIKTFDNGEMDIAIEAIRVFKLLEFSHILTPKLYGAGIIQYEDEITDKPSYQLQELTKEYMWVSQQNIIPIDAFDNSTIYSVARLIELSAAEKYELLKAKSALEKEDSLKPKIKLFIHLIKTETELKSKFVLN